MKKRFNSVGQIFLAVVLLTLLSVVSAQCSSAQPEAEPAIEIEQDLGGRQDVKIAETTRTLDETTTKQHLSSISEDNSVIVFSEEILTMADLSMGNVLAIEPMNKVPDGLLRKVINVTKANGQVEIETVQASLVEAIETGEVHEKIILTRDDVRELELSQVKTSVKVLASPLRDSLSLIIDTKDKLPAGVRATGTINIDPSFDFDLVIEDFTLKQLVFINTTKISGRLELKTELVQIELVDVTVPVAVVKFKPISVPVGSLFAIWLTPVMTVYVGVDGNVSANITTAVTQDVTFHTGFTYDETAAFETINESSGSDLRAEPPVFSDGVKVRTYIRPMFELLIYGVVGPYAKMDVSMNFEAGLTRTPLWEIYGEVTGKVGVEIEIVSYVVAKWEDAVYERRWLIAQADIPASTCSGTEMGGFCWYFGEENVSCDAVCAPHGGYDNATRTYAGSSSSSDNCRSVIAILNVDLDDFFETTQGGLGCFAIQNASGNYTGYWDEQPTTADATYVTPGRRRICACQR